MKHFIIGFWWKGSLNCQTIWPFVGELDLKNNGTFEGKVEDKLGCSNLRGEIREDKLRFVKKYVIPDPQQTCGAAKFPIQYELVKEKDGMWRGVFTLDEREDGEFFEQRKKEYPLLRLTVGENLPRRGGNVICIITTNMIR